MYVINDIVDVNLDRLHPEKKNRPIASGEIKVINAYGLVISLLVLAIILLMTLNKIHRIDVTFVIGIYFIINIFYSFGLKNIPILDVLIIAVGFVLRIFAGGITAGIGLSHWIVLMTFLLALLLGFAKRRDDVLFFEKTGTLPRKNTKYYNRTFINQLLSIAGSITIICYIMYTLSDEVINRLHNHSLYITSIFVIAGIFRYLHITLVGENSGNPTRVLIHDHFIQICLFLWVLSFLLIIYIKV